MLMARITSWRSLFVAVAAAAATLGCEEKLTAPGTCPDYCPSDSIEVVDTILTGIVVSDTSLRGFTESHDLPIMQVSNRANARARALIKFQKMPERWFVGADTILVGTIDSVVLEMRMTQRDSMVDTLRFLVHDVPPTAIDSTATFASTDAFFTDATIIDSMPVADSVVVGQVRRLLPIPVLTPDPNDSLVPSYGLSLRAETLTVATLQATEAVSIGGLPPNVRIYVRGAAPRDTFRTVFSLVPVFDGYVQDPPPAAPTDTTILVGNQPAARAFLHFTIPPFIADTATVVRATLLLNTTRPATGRPTEQFAVEAAPVIRYFVGKSIIFGDANGFGNGLVTTGDSGTISIEMVNVMRLWRGVSIDSLPRIVVLRNADEGQRVGEIEVFGSGAASVADRPRLQITYVRPLRFGVP